MMYPVDRHCHRQGIIKIRKGTLVGVMYGKVVLKEEEEEEEKKESLSLSPVQD